MAYGDIMLKSDIYVNKNKKVLLEEMKRKVENNDISILSFVDKIEKEKGILSTTYFHGLETKRKKEILELKKLREDITIFHGIEIPNSYQRKEELRLYNSFPIDVLVGSVDKIEKNLQDQEEIEREFENYYLRNLRTVLTGNIDVLAHLGSIDNDYNYPYYNYKLMDTILKKMIEKDIVLQVDKNLNEIFSTATYPNYTLLKRYHELGGEKVVLSSGEDSNLNSLYTLILDLDLKPGYFEKRKFKSLI